MAERRGHLHPGGRVFVLGAVPLLLDCEKAWCERQSRAGEMSLSVQCALKLVLSIACCVKPGQELFCAGISTPSRGEGGRRAADWRICIPIPCLSVCSRVKNMGEIHCASGYLGSVPRSCISVREVHVGKRRKHARANQG